MILRNCLLIVFTLACVTTDLLYGKIANVIVIPAAAIGLALHGLTEGPEGLAAALLTALLTMGLFYPIWRVTGGKGIGAGDVKLLAALGAILPGNAMLVVLAVTFVSAAAAGVIRRLSGKSGNVHLALYAALGALLHVGGLY